jgi:hypothetical protein
MHLFGLDVFCEKTFELRQRLFRIGQKLGRALGAALLRSGDRHDGNVDGLK